MSLNAIRSMVVKLLKAHHLSYMNCWQEPDPETGVAVTLLKFRRTKEHSPKAFFDSLNESGLQYKKISKDPDAIEVICELWPKGMKRKITKMRSDSRKGVGYGKGESDDDSPGGPGGSLNYIAIPSGDSMSNLVQSAVSDLRSAGLHEEADTLLKISGAQPWDEFRRKLGQMFHSIKLHQRPEIRQLREQLAGDILSTLGNSASLIEGMSSADLDKKLTEIISDNLDLVLDTRGLADSLIRRVSTHNSPRLSQLIAIDETLEDVSSVDAHPEFQARVASLRTEVSQEISGVNKKGSLLDLEAPLMSSLAQGDTFASYLLLLED